MSEKLTDTSHEASDSGKTAIPSADQAIDPGKMTEAPGGGVDTSFTTNLGQIGDYRLLREVGRGGMGIVYEAEQISLRRRVALKILPFAGGADSRQLQRFRNEAEAAAHLHHSNIVPVFAVGSERGVHFYAMQFIEGQSLAALISDMSGDTSGSQSGAGQALLARPRTPVSTMVAQSTLQSGRTRGFFLTVATIGKQTAEALEYAHQMGVVHRDIKPANLLLDASGRVWVTDFGLAQFQNQAGVTVTGELLGTLRYVSPEQAMAKRGLVGNLTDIYSLGATLYELLTLKPVFDARERHALLHQVAFDEPAPPRSIDPSIPFELETIVLKALSKTPAERYGSAQEMADDLQRFLEDKPIQAKRPSLVERTRKWMRRHPALVAATLLVLGLGVIGFGVSTAMVASEQAKTQAAYESERLQKAETEAALKREEKRAREAEQLFQLARRSVDDMIALSVEELSDNHAMLALRRELLEAALVYYDEFIELRRENPNAQADLAATRDRVKHLLEDLAVLQGQGQHFLLKQQTVLGELKATKEQRKNFDQLLRDWEKDRQELFKGFHKIPPEERQSRFATLARKNDTAIAKVLSAGQLAHFKQIDIQSKGPLAFREPEIAAALKLTAEQKNKIRAIEAGGFVDAVALAKPGPPEAMFRKVQEDRRQATMRQIIDVLTEEQARQWRELTGPALAEPIFMPAAQRPFNKGPKKGP